MLTIKTEIPRIDFSKIAMQSARDYKIKTIQSEIARVGGLDKILITDCLSNKDRDGLLVMKTLTDAIGNNPNVRYKIKVLKDMWGNPMKPGDEIEWKFEIKIRDMFGKKLTHRQRKEYIRRGERDMVEEWHSATIDGKGCVDVPFRDAAILLNTRGVHFESGLPIMNHTYPERSKKITRDHYEKEYANVIGTQHYWLYCEVPTDVYEQLPITKKKRKTETTNDSYKMELGE